MSIDSAKPSDLLVRLPSFLGREHGFARADVVARKRYGLQALGELDLTNHQAAMPEAALRRREIELPHPTESLVVKRFGLITPSEKPLAPSLEGLGVMQPQDFDVGYDEPRALDGGQHFRESRHRSARKDVLRNPTVGGIRSIGTTNGMQEHRAVIGE